MWLNPQRVTLARSDRRWNCYEEIVRPRLLPIVDRIETSSYTSKLYIGAMNVIFSKQTWNNPKRCTVYRILHRNHKSFGRLVWLGLLYIRFQEWIPNEKQMSNNSLQSFFRIDSFQLTIRSGTKKVGLSMLTLLRSSNISISILLLF